MKRLVKILLRLAIVLVVLGIIACLAVNHWLQSAELHARIEHELSRVLHVPVKLEKLKISLLEGMTVSGITVPDRGGNFFEATGFTVRHRPGPLLRGMLVFEEIRIENPKFFVVQQEDGTWKGPSLPEELKTEPDPAKVKDAKPKEDKAKEPSKKWDSRVKVQRVRIVGGSAEILDSARQPLGSLSGVNITFGTLSSEVMEGSFQIQQAVFSGWGTLGEVSGGFCNREKKAFLLPQLSAKLGGGTLTANFNLKMDVERGWTGRLALENVNMEQLGPEGEALRMLATGVFSGKAEIRGQGNDLKKLSGKGTVSMKEGSFSQLDTVREIGVVLGITEMANLKIADGQLDFMIGMERVFVTTLTLHAPPLAVKAKGTVRFEGKLGLDAELLGEERFISSRPSIEAQFSPPDAEHYRAVKFELRGSLKKPKHNILERITGTKSKKGQRMILGEALLFGPTDAEAKEEPPADQESTKEPKEAAKPARPAQP